MRRLLVTLAVASAAAAGCGDEEEESRTVTVRGSDEVRVAAHEYSFDPDTVIYERGGRREAITISLDNRGSLAHNLKVFDGDDEVGGTPTLQAGREESGTFELGPGEYRMVCTVGDHEELGMSGTLEVR